MSAAAGTVNQGRAQAAPVPCMHPAPAPARTQTAPPLPSPTLLQGLGLPLEEAIRFWRTEMAPVRARGEGMPVAYSPRSYIAKSDALLSSRQPRSLPVPSWWPGWGARCACTTAWPAVQTRNCCLSRCRAPCGTAGGTRREVRQAVPVQRAAQLRQGGAAQGLHPLHLHEDHRQHPRRGAWRWWGCGGGGGWARCKLRWFRLGGGCYH